MEIWHLPPSQFLNIKYVSRMDRLEHFGFFVFQIFSFKDFFCLNTKILMVCLGIVSIRLMLMKEKSFVLL